MSDKEPTAGQQPPNRKTRELTQPVLDDNIDLQAHKARLVRTGEADEGAFELPAREIIAGSALDCDVFVDHPTLSRHHFAITRDSLAFLIRDLNSTNGTFVNDVRIKESYLQSGSRIQAGKITFRFEILA